MAQSDGSEIAAKLCEREAWFVWAPFIMKLELKRYNNIVAFKMKGKADTALAFHEDNLEVAQISDELFSELEKKNYDELVAWSRRKEVLPAHPKNNKIKSVNINVTQICNLHCLYCAAGGDGSYGDPVKNISIEKTLPQLKFFLDKLEKGERFHISFLGGEPLLYPEGISLIAEYASQYAEAKALNLTMKITTNGTLLNESIVSLLKKHKPTLVISMDGPPEINDKLRPQKNSHSTSMQMVSNLDRLFMIKSELGVLGVHAVFSEKNLEVVKAYKYFSEFPFDFYDFMFSVSENNPTSNHEYMEQMEQVAELAWEKGSEKELRKIYIFDHYFDLLDNQKRLENHCGLGKTLAVIDARNRIYNCPWTIGQKQDQIGQDLQINQEKLIENYSNSLIDRNQCHQCWAKYLCGGGCSYIHKSTYSDKEVVKNDLFCERTRYVSALAIYYFSKSRDLMT
ncbi:MAG: radical SAM protein [Deltaproteobacteria bacterium]|nr:radical SAM protein [Deltaproteobacteria bacterium]